MALATLAATILAGCGSPLSPGAALLVQVRSVTPGYPASVDFSVTNLTHQRLWLSRCGDRIMTAIDTAAGLTWRQVSGDGCLDVAPQWPLAIEPGATRGSTRGLYAHGRFRLRIGAASAADADYSWTPGSSSFEIP